MNGYLLWRDQLMNLNEIIDALVAVSRDPMIRLIVPILGVAMIVDKCIL